MVDCVQVYVDCAEERGSGKGISLGGGRSSMQCSLYIYSIAIGRPCLSEVVIPFLIGWCLRPLRGRGHLLIGVVETHCVVHHCSTTLRRGDIVGPLVCSSVGSKTPTARCHGKTWAIVAEWLDEGGCVVDGRRGRAPWCGLSADGAGKDGFVHTTH